MALSDAPDFTVFLGDEAGIYVIGDPPSFMNQERAFMRWKLWRTVCAPLLAACPSFFVLGNHEGEAGYYQSHTKLDRHGLHYQRWGTIARKRFCLNPLPDTYPEGGEDERWRGNQSSPATGGCDEGNCSPLQNYFAWSWGDALFVVLDVHRYTNPGRSTPDKVEQWTLGHEQLIWMEQVLLKSRAKWKFVIAHHLVGGSDWDLLGVTRNTRYVYGRGGAHYAHVGEQARITEIMKHTGAQFFLYGHDHIFSHQETDGIYFVCNGRTTFLNAGWWRTPGWKEAYGSIEARNPNDFYAAVGYTRMTISPEQVRIEYVRSGTDPLNTENVIAGVGNVVCRVDVT